MAVAQLKVPAVNIGMAPKPGSRTFVGLPNWLWAYNGAAPKPTATAALGGLSITATATLSQVFWSMGDGHAVTCPGAGSVWHLTEQITSSPDCGYTYAVPSNVNASGTYTVTATATWNVSWTGAATGNTTMQRSASLPVKVGEIQVLVTSG